MAVEVPSRDQWNYCWIMKMWPVEPSTGWDTSKDPAQRCAVCAGKGWHVGSSGMHVRCPLMGPVSRQVMPERHWAIGRCFDCGGLGESDGRIQFRDGATGHPTKKGDECPRCFGDGMIASPLPTDA